MSKTRDAVTLECDARSSSEAEIVEALERGGSLNLTSSGKSSESMSDNGDPELGLSMSASMAGRDSWRRRDGHCGCDNDNNE